MVFILVIGLPVNGVMSTLSSVSAFTMVERNHRCVRSAYDITVFTGATPKQYYRVYNEISQGHS